MVQLEIVDEEYVSDFKKDVTIFLNISEENLKCLLKVIENGKKFYDIIDKELYEEVIKEICEMCSMDIEIVKPIMRLFYNIADGYGNDTYKKIFSDLEKINIDIKGISRFKIIIDTFEEMKSDLIYISKIKNISEETFPSLKEVNISLDVRYSIENEEITNKVPVLIMGLETDDDNESIYCQMDLGMARYLLSKLSEIFNVAIRVEKDLKRRMIQ